MKKRKKHNCWCGYSADDVKDFNNHKHIQLSDTEENMKKVSKLENLSWEQQRAKTIVDNFADLLLPSDERLNELEFMIAQTISELAEKEMELDVEEIYKVCKEAWVGHYAVDKGYLLHQSEIDCLEKIAQVIVKDLKGEK